MKPKPPQKKFRQLLQEQQQPFELEDNLLERMYSRKSLNRESGFVCIGGKFGSIKKLGKGFIELHRKFKKLVSINEERKTKKLGDNGLALNVTEGRSCLRVAESEKFSSACNSTAFGSCSGRDDEETSTSTRRDHTDSSTSDTSDTSRAPELCKLKVVQDVRTGKPSLIRARPTDNRLGNGVTLNKKVQEDTILSATLWDLLVYSAATEKTNSSETAEFQELVRSNSAPKVLISKGVLHQTKQLLFDCVKEVVKTHSKRGSNLGSQELGRLISEKMKSLGEEANLPELLKSDYLDSVAEWRDLEPQKRLVGTEIGEIILKEITNEFVTELNESVTCYQLSNSTNHKKQ